MKIVFQINLLIIILNYSFCHSQNVKNFYSVRDSISGYSIYNHLQILAHDSLQGRGVGSIGGNIAADYIAKQFEKFGLEKIASENSYFQNIPMHGSLPLSASELTSISESDTAILEYGKDYFLYRAGQQTFIPLPLPMVFVGYGIVAPEFDYNDYQSVDVEDKIVLFIDGEPESDDEDYFNGLAPTVYSYSESKRRIAISRGASGTIQIPLTQFESWNVIKKDFDSEDVTLAYSVSSSLSIILNPAVAEKLFNNSNYSFSDVILMHQQNRMKSFPLKSKINIK